MELHLKMCCFFIFLTASYNFQLYAEQCAEEQLNPRFFFFFFGNFFFFPQAAYLMNLASADTGLAGLGF